MKEKINLSLIIPAYNEEKIIKDTLEKAQEYLSGKEYSWEILVVDDGSTDNTSKIAKAFRNKKIKLLKLKKNKGKGAALRKGFLLAKGDYIFYSDADLSVPLDNIDKFLKQLKSGFQVVIASRRVEGAEIAVHQPALREFMGRLYTLLTKAILTTNLADFTCGFKGFSKAAAKDIFSKAKINRWAYDSEILFLANKFGYKIKQYPVVWKNRQDTRVVLADVVGESLKDLFKIRLYELQGEYNK